MQVFHPADPKKIVLRLFYARIFGFTLLTFLGSEEEVNRCIQD